MQIFSAEVYVLAVTDLGDRDRVVTFLSTEHGQQRGVAQGAKRRYSRFSGSLQLLAKVAATWVAKEGRDLVRLRDAELIEPAAFLLDDLEGLLLTTYLADTVTAFSQEGAHADHLFRLLSATLRALAAGADRDTMARYVEAWVLRLEGIFPAPVECPRCGRSLVELGAASVGDAGLICGPCATSEPSAYPVEAAVVAFLRQIGARGPAGVAANAPTPAVLRQVEALCGRVRRHFLGHELKSYEVMKQTLAPG